MSGPASRLSVIRRHLNSTARTNKFFAAECVELKKPLVIVEKELEPLDDNEIRIKTKACGLNFATYLTTRGEYQVKKEAPFVPGSEICGEVMTVGKDVSGFVPGDIVVGLLDSSGLQEVITLPDYYADVGALYKLPQRLTNPDYGKLASIVVNYGTAWMALTRKGQVKEGDVVVVTGASGGVGLAAVELCSKIFKCKVIAVCRTEKGEQVKAYGAEDIIDYTTQNIRQSLRELAPDGVNVVFDTVGGDGAVDLVKSMSFEGRFITIGYTAGIPKIPANLLLLKSATAVGLWWGNTMQTAPEAFKESVDTVMKMYLNGEIDPLVQKSFPIDQTNEAFKMIADRQVIGKLVVSM